MSELENAIILHGACERAEYFSSEYPAQSNSHWLPWMQKQLLIRGIAAQTPEMPDPYAPDYNLWKRELERYDIGPKTLLIGYSCGAGFLLRWLSERLVPIAKLILVAPWLDPERARTDAFFDFEIDSTLAKRADAIDLLVSDDDHPSIQKSVERIIAAIPPIRVHRFCELGHFTSDDLGSTAFPQLRAIAFE